MQPRRFLSRALSAVISFLLLAGCGQAEGPLGNGLYLRQSLGLNGSGDVSTILLGPGNRIVMNPEGGVDPFDSAKTDPAKVGTYTFDGKSQITIQWGGGGTPQTRRVEFQYGKLSGYDGGVMTKAGAYGKNQTLDASYSGSSDLFANKIGTISGTRAITFTKAGKFALSATGVATSSTADAVANKAQQGTYTLSGNTLTLNFADGTATKYTVLPFNAALDPSKTKIGDEKIIFDRMLLSRVK